MSSSEGTTFLARMKEQRELQKLVLRDTSEKNVLEPILKPEGINTILTEGLAKKLIRMELINLELELENLRGIIDMIKGYEMTMGEQGNARYQFLEVLKIMVNHDKTEMESRNNWTGMKQ